MQKALTYQTFFNFQRPDSYKENKTPWQLAKEKCPNLQEEALLLHPVDPDALMDKRVVCGPLGGYDVCFRSLNLIFCGSKPCLTAVTH